MKIDYIRNIPVKNTPAGRDLDILIAEKVMGLCIHNWDFIETESDDGGVGRKCKKCSYEFWGLNPPLYGDSYGSYSTSIFGAWEVVEKMQDTFSFFLSSDNPPTDEEHKWTCEFYYKEDPTYIDHEVYAPTAPLAICRVALLCAMGI